MRAADRIRASFRAHADLASRFLESSLGAVEGAARALAGALREGHVLLFFGNGGSAADAQHLAAEFVNRFGMERPALPAIALTTDTSVLTSIANDEDFARVFARQVEALGGPGDVAVGLSTSGRSENVLEGLRAARDRGLLTLGLTGRGGGPMRRLCRHLIAVPSRETPRIQEIHILVGHILCQLVDDALFPGRRSSRPAPGVRRAPRR
ncbi:MAG: SIS domain-containing protein [Acidobacteriota bacterium]